MQKEKKHDDSLEELTRVAKELSRLIEDNNQNVKDCYRALKSIENVLCPKRENAFLSLFRKLLNKCVRL